MKKLEEIQSKKTISSYGGSCSVIETLNNGSLLIEPYNKWKCYSSQNLGKRKKITNPRLLEEIKKDSFYSHITQLVEIPDADLSERVYMANNNDTATTIRTKYFPEWFFCPQCRKLHRIEEWRQKWDETFNEGNSTFSVNNPACYNCSHRRNGRGGIFRKRLEQIRFVMASFDTGELADIPFDLLWDMPNDGKEWKLDNAQLDPTGISYHTSQGGDGLQSVYIKKGNGDNTPQKRLSTIYNKYLVFTEDKTITYANYSVEIKKGAYRVVLRNGTNLYFPNILSCIYIPKPDNAQIDSVKNLAAKGLDSQTIYDAIGKALKLSLTQIEDIINPPKGLNEDDEIRMGEFNYITNPNIYRNNHRLEKDYHSIRYPNLKSKRIKSIYSLTQLKETSVLLSYTRISNGEKRWWSIENNREIDRMRPGQVKPFSLDNGPTFMPAIEAYGEGLLFVVDPNGIDDVERSVFVHTFSHLLMKELEFLCGYPVTSLKERIYENNNTLGFLIYTIQGAEGSYGGLTSLMPSDTNSDGSNGDAKILKLIDMAIERAKDCSNDPICSSEGGHCFACVDLPETSCETFNQGLDRRVFLKHINSSSSGNNSNNNLPDADSSSEALQDYRKNNDEKNDDSDADPNSNNDSLDD